MRRNHPNLAFGQSTQVSSNARRFPFAKRESDREVSSASVDEILGSPITLKEELELFLNALEGLPEPPSNLVIDEAEVFDPENPLRCFGKRGWYEIHKALEWEPKWGNLKNARYPEVHKRILEVERLNKPEKNLRKRADALREIASIKEKVKNDLMYFETILLSKGSEVIPQVFGANYFSLSC